MPIIQPMKAGPAPSDMANGVRIGYCACRSKKARNRNRYSHSAVFTVYTSGSPVMTRKTGLPVSF
ncbi:hypothetical protein D3C80_1727270 [compost metagenome]